MTTPRSSWLCNPTIGFIYLLAFVSLVLATDRLHQGLQHSPKADTPDLIAPPGELFRQLALEQHSTVADLYFLRLVQHLGTPSMRELRYPLILPLASLITDLDPLYAYAYEVAGITLADPAGRFEESVRILEKGIKAVPERWQLPFFAAFNLWHAKGDYAGAAPLVLKASKLPGSPKYLADLSSRLFAESGEVETGIALFDTLLAEPLPLEFRRELEERRRALSIEGDLRIIDAAAAEFAAIFGRRPTSLEELRAAVPLPALATEVEIDSKTGEIKNSRQPGRVRLFRADRDSLPLAKESVP